MQDDDGATAKLITKSKDKNENQAMQHVFYPAKSVVVHTKLPAKDEIQTLLNADMVEFKKALAKFPNDDAPPSMHWHLIQALSYKVRNKSLIKLIVESDIYKKIFPETVRLLPNDVKELPDGTLTAKFVSALAIRCHINTKPLPGASYGVFMDNAAKKPVLAGFDPTAAKSLWKQLDGKLGTYKPFTTRLFPAILGYIGKLVDVDAGHFLNLGYMVHLKWSGFGLYNLVNNMAGIYDVTGIEMYYVISLFVTKPEQATMVQALGALTESLDGMDWRLGDYDKSEILKYWPLASPQVPYISFALTPIATFALISLDVPSLINLKCGTYFQKARLEDGVKLSRIFPLMRYFCKHSPLSFADPGVVSIGEEMSLGKGEDTTLHELVERVADLEIRKKFAHLQIPDHKKRGVTISLAAVTLANAVISHKLTKSEWTIITPLLNKYETKNQNSGGGSAPPPPIPQDGLKRLHKPQNIGIKSSRNLSALAQRPQPPMVTAPEPAPRQPKTEETTLTDSEDDASLDIPAAELED